ncbi:hypothetical protein JKP88DRAFT_256992 [Tribonema minus]|uniref:Uncharacterized protein n=1 Tax=Tribonema minus TaxID=303371 RepID=A0A835ZBZ6_9STRA|nr:hypothetical protein JKP88DRAFT_256992 [Tribonema minus]
MCVLMLSPRTTVKTEDIIGFGSLLSETSARHTFPQLHDFHFVRVHGYRRVMTHPASIFFQRGIAVAATKEFSSLSTEAHEGAHFVASVFQIDGLDLEAYVEREEEFDFMCADYTGLDDPSETGTGLMCARSTDAAYLARWGQSIMDERYGAYGITSVWDAWHPGSGILPCPVYLRHCMLAATAQGSRVLDSFLDETFLSDRVTTVRQHLHARPDIMETEPPAHLIGRYSG